MINYTYKPLSNKRILALFGFLFSFSTLFSQENTVITGKILDANSAQPVSNVTVSVRGASDLTTQSDEGGNYSITATSTSIIVFRHIGYNELTIEIAERKEINVELTPKDEGLDEVVVVAFGKQKKETLTGAIASINTREIKQSPAANLAVTLAGRLPGLAALQRGGQPGADITQLYIRGMGTINAQSPIILVDGVERELTYIDPNEVETITILKDASSTATFGVRGANGVILVTTKRGTSQIPQINFTSEYSLQDFTRELAPVNSYEYATLRNLANKNDGLQPYFSDAVVEKYRDQSDPARFPNTNWRDILLKDYSQQNRYNLNISGAGRSVDYFVNAGYLGQGGQFNVEDNLNYDPSFKLDRYNFRSNIDMRINKGLKAFLNVAGYVEKVNSPIFPADHILAFAFMQNATNPGPLSPTGAVMTTDVGPVGANPAYGQVNRMGYVKSSRTNVTATFGMEQALDFITQGLSTKAVLSFDTRSINDLRAQKNYERAVQVINPNLQGADGLDSVYYVRFENNQDSPLAISGAKSYTSLSNFQAYLNYNRSFAQHQFTGLLLYQQQQNVINEELPYNLRGVASRLTYGYRNRYFFEFNAGYNGSEQFEKGRRFGFFPAFSGSWVISNEKMFEDMSFLSLLKLRGSHGRVGNDRMGSRRFLYLDDIQVGGGYSGSLGNGQGIDINLLRNEYIQWEVAKKTNIAIEIGFLNSINLSIDLFSEKRDNILRTISEVPLMNGLAPSAMPPVNNGVIENKGYEIELTYRKTLHQDFSILSKINVNYAANRQLFLDQNAIIFTDYATEFKGYRIGQRFGYMVDRYFESSQDIQSSPSQSVGGHPSRPGNFKYVDKNGDDLINILDQGPIGYSSVPEYTFGWATNINYKSFDFSVLLQGISNVSNVYPAGEGWVNYLKIALNSWTEENAASDKVMMPRLTTQSSPDYVSNSYTIQDASYLRLRNMEIGYTLPIRISERIGSNRIRFYANGLNLITWDRLRTEDYDPELTNGNAYPIPRLYNIGVNIVF